MLTVYKGVTQPSLTDDEHLYKVENSFVFVVLNLLFAMCGMQGDRSLPRRRLCLCNSSKENKDA